MRFSHSIRWRLLVWNTVLLAAVVVVLLVAFHRHERRNRLQWEDLRLRQSLFAALPAIRDLLPGFDGPETTRELPGRDVPYPETIAGSRVWVAVLSPQGAPRHRSAGAPERMDAFVREASGLTEPPGSASEKTADIAGNRVLLHRHPGDAVVVIGVPTDSMEADMARLAVELFVAGAAIVGTGLGVGLFMVTRALRPISRISSVAERIAHGELSSRIDVAETESELGRLAVVLNTTFDALHDARERVVRFTADASHELRTPLAVILANTGGTLRRERSPEEYREALEAADLAAKRMKQLSDDLLELTRGDADRDASQTMPCDFADIADEAVAMLTPLAKENDATLVADLHSCPVTGDPVRLGRVLVNLISNAILHNAAGVRVTVVARASGDTATMTVADDGKGIPAEHLDKIFDRFRRADASRSRHTGGSGLGLAIVKQTVESHGGTVAVESIVGRGTTMRVTLPLRTA